MFFFTIFIFFFPPILIATFSTGKIFSIHVFLSLSLEAAHFIFIPLMMRSGPIVVCQGVNLPTCSACTVSL